MIQDAESIAAAAEKELKDERFRAAVEAKKEQLRGHRARSWWQQLFPWRITITRKTHVPD